MDDGRLAASEIQVKYKTDDKESRSTLQKLKSAPLHLIYQIVWN